jgi:hypothetical protein
MQHALIPVVFPAKDPEVFWIVGPTLSPWPDVIDFEFRSFFTAVTL